MHSFKKGQQILAVSQKGGEVRAYSREKMSDRITPDSFFSDTHAFVAPQPVRFFFLTSSRLTTKCILFTHSAQKNFRCRSSRVRQERVFRPLLVTQLFHALGEKEKKFLPCVQARQDAFLYHTRAKMHHIKLTCLL